MRALLLFLFLSLASGLPPVGVAFAEPARFFSAFEDLPLPPGLEEQTEANIAFYGASGRIQQAEARGRNTQDEVLNFYRASLPALGWAAAPGESAVYARGRERLTLDFTREADGVVTLHVRVLSLPASVAVD